MPDRVPAIKVLLMPKDINALGTIFGGVIFSHVDLASADELIRSINALKLLLRPSSDFKKPDEEAAN